MEYNISDLKDLRTSALCKMVKELSGSYPSAKLSRSRVLRLLVNLLIDKRMYKGEPPPGFRRVQANQERSLAERVRSVLADGKAHEIHDIATEIRETEVRVRRAMDSLRRRGIGITWVELRTFQRSQKKPTDKAA